MGKANRGGLGLLVQTGVRKPRGPRTTATYFQVAMDLDEMFDEAAGAEQTESSYGSKPVQKRGASVPVDDDHPFDLESYMSIYTGAVNFVESFSRTSITPSYTGPTAVHRLIHIANHSPTLAPAALQSAIQTILQTSNTSLYSSTVQDYNALISTRDAIPVDQSWIEESLARNATEKNRLEVELKQYTSNMIKESIRVSTLISCSSQGTCNSTMIDGTSRFGRLLPLHR